MKYFSYLAQIGLVMLILLVVSALIYLSFRDISQALYPSVTTQTPTLTPTPTVTSTPTVTPEKAAGPIWIVSRIEEGLLHENGFVYDIATFTNLDKPSVTLRARCSAPDWPSPEIGQQYTINEYRVMIPIEGIYSPLQRFWVLE